MQNTYPQRSNVDLFSKRSSKRVPRHLPASCELADLIGVETETIANALATITDVLEENKTRPLYRFEFSRVNGLLRCWLLRNALSSTAAPKLSDFIDYIDSLERLPTNDTSTSQRDRHEKERRNKAIGALFPIYVGDLMFSNSDTG